MSKTLDKSLSKIDEDLATSWVDLSEKVRELALTVAERSTGTELASQAKSLATQTSKLCDHVEKIHKDVGEFIDGIESRMAPPNPHEVDYSTPEVDPTADETRSPDNQTEAINRENIRIQQEQYEAKSDFKNIIKALFMWKDDPTERLKEKDS